MNYKSRAMAFTLWASVPTMVATPILAQTVVVDVNDRLVGYLLDAEEDHEKVELNIAGTWYAIRANVSGFYLGPKTNVYFYFKTVDCSGQSYMDVTGTGGRAGLLPSAHAVSRRRASAWVSSPVRYSSSRATR